MARLGLILLLTFVVYLAALPHEFTLDSYALLQQDTRLTEAAPWSRVLASDWWGDQAVGGLYRPLPLALFRFEKLTLSFSPVGFALFNLALHLLAVLMLWRLVLRWNLGPRTAWMACLLWAVHPIVVDVVPNLVGLCDLLATLSVISSLYAWERYVVQRRRWWLLIAVALALVGLFSKESAAVLGPLIVWRELVRWRLDAPGLPARSTSVLPLRSRVVSLIALAGGYALWAAVRISVLGPLGPRQIGEADNPLIAAAPIERILTALHLQGLYLLHALVPTTLSADYSFNQIPLIASPLNARFIASALALTALIALVSWTWLARSRALLGLGWYLIALVPVSNLLVTTGTIMADRILYLPLAGLCVAVAVALDRMVQRQRAVRWGVVAAGLVLTLFTFVHAQQWRSERNLWEHTVRNAPDSVKAHLGLASVLDTPGAAPAQRRRSFEHAQHALTLARQLRKDLLLPAYLQFARSALALAPMLGDPQSAQLLRAEAAAVLEKAVELHAARQPAADAGQAVPPATGPRWITMDPLIPMMLAQIALDANDAAGARHWLEYTLTLDPANAPARAQLALVLEQLGQLDAARDALVAALQQQPDQARWLDDLGRVELARCNWPAALDAFVRAQSIHPRAQHPGWIEEAAVRWVRQLIDENNPAAARDLAALLQERLGIRPEAFPATARRHEEEPRTK